MRYVNITKPDINNGKGCRVTLWVSGCNRKCEMCHNPELWNYFQGNTLDKAFDVVCEYLALPYIKGLTLSGGDPLDQTEENLRDLIIFITKIKENYPDKDIWIYSGDYYENLVKNELCAEVLKMCDILVDGPYIHEERDITLPFRGSRNQRIINLKKTFQKHNVIIEDIE